MSEQVYFEDRLRDWWKHFRHWVDDLLDGVVSEDDTERTAFKHDLMDAPTIDAVEVVRCRECKFANFDFPDHLEWVYCERHYMYSMADDFCSYGETEKGRKNNE